MEINLSKDYEEKEKTPLGFEEPDRPAPGFEYEVSNDEGSSFCTQCGQPLNGAAFCPHCGHKAGNGGGGYQRQQSGNANSTGYAGYTGASNMNTANPHNVNYNYQPTASGGKERNKIVAILLAVFTCGILSAIYDGDSGRLIRNIILTCCGIGGLAIILDILKISKYPDTYYV